MREFIDALAKTYKSIDHVVVAFATALIALLFMFIFSEIALGQNKFFGTPNRGIEGARGNAQIKALNDSTTQNRSDIQALADGINAVANSADASVTTINDELLQNRECGNQGKIFGPDHTDSGIEGCIDTFEIKSDGIVSLNSGIQIGHYPSCTVANEGVLRYEPSQKVMHYCNGVAWQELGGAPKASGAYNDVENANIAQTYTSNAVTLSGFFGTRTATVTGSGNPQLVVNGTPVGSTATVEAGNALAIRLTSSGSYGTARTANITLSSFTQSWTVTTGTVSYGSWSSWGGCSVSCGGGSQTRTRTCNFSGGGTVGCSACGGNCSDSQSCNTHSCCTPSAHVTGTGGCSASCGGGSQTVYWSDGCGSTWTSSQSCNTHSCGPVCTYYGSPSRIGLPLARSSVAATQYCIEQLGTGAYVNNQTNVFVGGTVARYKNCNPPASSWCSYTGPSTEKVSAIQCCK